MLNTGFIRKEFQEIYQTPKIIILMAVFVFFGLLSPLTARYMIEIIAYFDPNMAINFPDPTHLDAWDQVIKNITSIGIIVFLILMTGSVAQEKAKGSMMLVLTKRVSRFNFLFSKLVAGIVLFMVCYVVSILISMSYTQLLFGTLIFEGWWLALIAMLVMGFFFASLGLLVSVMAKSATSAALLGFLAFGLISMISMINGLVKYNPASGSTIAFMILNNSYTLTTVITYIISSLVFTVLCFGVAYKLFRKQEI